MTEKCDVCGRTIEELEDELSLKSDIVEHQGVKKCEKCVSEYNKACPSIETQDVIPEDADMSDTGKDWKEKAIA